MALNPDCCLHQPLDFSQDEFRLITILPLPPNASDSAPVECLLQNFCLNDAHLTPAYKLHLRDKTADGAWHDTRDRSELISLSGEFGDWTEVLQHTDDATTHLPEFRYEWGDFMAISYTWGGFTDSPEILVNGLPLAITRNAEACLRELRRKDYARSGWKFWMDAICINQQDIVERGSVVKSMREIYMKSWTPLVWLGEELNGSNNALDVIRILARDYSSTDRVNQLTNDLRRNPQHFGQGRWRAVYELVRRPYWRRLWIFQEVALGRRTIPVLCGGRTLSWFHFARAFSLLIETDEVINTYITQELKETGTPLDITIWPSLFTAGEIQSLQDMQLQGKRTNTYRLLNLTSLVFCADPRDKVYGLLGIMEQALASLIEPDYTDSIENVYRSFTLTTIEATGSLDIIRYAKPDTDFDLPSWVPDLTVLPNTGAITLSEASFAASGSLQAEVQPLPDQRLLSCKGIIVDRFDGMGTMWSKGWTPDSKVQTKGSANPYGTFEGAREAIWKSMIASHSIRHERSDVDYSSLLATPALAEADLPEDSLLKDIVTSNIFIWCIKYLKSNIGFRIAGRNMEDYFSKTVVPDEIDTMHLRDALMRKDSVGLRRRMVVTERGYVGLALETVEQTDVVAILLGCSMPLVLRKLMADNGSVRWQVIGECYLHGLMDGEALQLGVDMENIVLC